MPLAATLLLSVSVLLLATPEARNDASRRPRTPAKPTDQVRKAAPPVKSAGPAPTAKRTVRGVPGHRPKLRRDRTPADQTANKVR
jgi:hypothetical protein